MTEDAKYQPKNETQPGDIAQRDFVAFSVTAGLAATAESAAAAGLDVVETNVEIKTPDGTRAAPPVLFAAARRRADSTRCYPWE